MEQFNYRLEELLDRKPITLDNNLISEQLNSKVILITGAAGSIGSELVRQVLKFEPRCIIMLDQAETPLYLLGLEIDSIASTSKVYSEIADVSNELAMREVFRRYRPDVVYHAAAYKHVQMMEKSPAQAIIANVLGTKIVAQLAANNGVSTFVFISTDKAVNPVSIMGVSKRIAEKYIQALHDRMSISSNSSIKFISTRFGNVLGSNGSVVPVFAKQIVEGGPVTITHPDITRYFMTIKEACQLVLEAGAMGRGGETYIFDMGKQIKIVDLAYKMIRLSSLEPEVDVKIKYIGLRSGEKLFEELITDESRILPTYNSNIMISREDHEDYNQIELSVDKLILLASQYNTFDLIAEIKKLVPEFSNTNTDFINPY
jgi:FlaA1/EpsC-like NDP-sugar epimerase